MAKPEAKQKSGRTPRAFSGGRCKVAKSTSRDRPRKRSGDQDMTLKLIVLITALLNLVKALIDFISRLTG